MFKCCLVTGCWLLALAIQILKIGFGLRPSKCRHTQNPYKYITVNP
jgi:hypothetical protein